MNYRSIVVGFAVLMLSGCFATVSQSNLYWGNYSSTLYQTKKTPGQESKNNHYAELQSIVTKSKEMNLRVPPGIYAELGIHSVERGDQEAAKNYFRLEEATYPESAALMKRAQNI